MQARMMTRPSSANTHQYPEEWRGGGGSSSTRTDDAQPLSRGSEAFLPSIEGVVAVIIMFGVGVSLIVGEAVDDDDADGAASSWICVSRMTRMPAQMATAVF